MRTLLPLFMLLGMAVMPVHALFEENASGVRAEGMGGSFCAVADDLSALDFNPAGLAFVQERQFQSFYKLLYGGVGVNLHTFHAGLALPLSRLGCLAGRVQETGFELQSQRSFKLGHGFLLADGLAFGYGINGYNFVQQELGSGYAFGLDVSLFARLARYWTVGFYGHNINLPKIGSSELPSVLVLGLGFSPRQGIQSSLQVSKEPGMPTRIALGQEFEVVSDYLVLRAGVQNEPVRFALGLGTGLRRVGIDYALITHPVLPFTHNFGLRVKF
ncbi:MAG: hypothetical protein N2248_06525 [candidate division WOR-3 bacterium]|uniref:PorV/PorQ family protein n=1 Tax=candidate division WOR-3 bacterium TaxID=2052148 RepID=A0A7C3IM58_UNCW3|nr:hypothetical protein [candidate division WOR-3 bacterium]